MFGYRLSEAARGDVPGILAWTHEELGEAGRLRYESLLVAALRNVASQPNRPRHFLMYRTEPTQVVMGRVLHDPMALARHLDPETPWASWVGAFARVDVEIGSGEPLPSRSGYAGFQEDAHRERLLMARCRHRRAAAPRKPGLQCRTPRAVQPLSRASRPCAATGAPPKLARWSRSHQAPVCTSPPARPFGALRHNRRRLWRCTARAP